MWVDVPTALAIAILASSAPRLAQRRGLTRVLLLGLLGDCRHLNWSQARGERWEAAARILSVRRCSVWLRNPRNA